MNGLEPSLNLNLDLPQMFRLKECVNTPFVG